MNHVAPKTVNFIALVICVLFIRLPASGATNDFTVSIRGERITLSAENTHLQTILTEIADHGITVRIDPLINPPITANYLNRPIEQVLGAILADTSYSLLWESTEDQAGSTEIRLAEIQIFHSGEKDRMLQLHPVHDQVIADLGEGRYFVKSQVLLQLPAGSDTAMLENYLQRYNATVTPGSIPDIYRIVFPGNVDIQAVIREIKKIFNIDSVELNYAYPIQKPVPYALSLPAADPGLGYYAPTDNPAPIAILDTGLSSDDLNIGNLVISSLDTLHPDSVITDTLGHGTQMALIATGVVKPYGIGNQGSDSYSPIIAIRAFDDSGFITDYNIMEGIHFALESKAKVMSLSWGTETNNAFMQKAFEYASANGLIVVAAAGNEPTGDPVYPAAYPSVIGVGALDAHGTEKWNKSNYGSFVAYYAPGFANVPVGYKGEPGVYAGTSISTAYVANSVSSFLSRNPSATRKEVLEFLDSHY